MCLRDGQYYSCLLLGLIRQDVYRHGGGYGGEHYAEPEGLDDVDADADGEPEEGDGCDFHVQRDAAVDLEVLDVRSHLRMGYEPVIQTA